MKYKLVVLDLDGTLLKDNKSISIQTVEYITRLKKTGVDVVIATGRSYYHGKKLIAPLKEDMIVLSNNGSIVRHTSDDEVIFSNYLKKSEARNIIYESVKSGFHPIIHINKFDQGYDLVIEKNPNTLGYNGYMEKDDVRYRRVSFEKINYEYILSVCIAGEFYKLENFRNNILKKYPNTYNSFTSRNLKIRALLEFLDVKGCKWEGIKRYAKSKDIMPEEIISIGDDNNDMELIKNSGLGIAMKNGTEEIKKSADKITNFDNNSEGVIKELRNHFNIGTESK
ncbi:MAG: HAD family hydrolase [Eubacteriales bacterium]